MLPLTILGQYKLMLIVFAVCATYYFYVAFFLKQCVIQNFCDGY